MSIATNNRRRIAYVAESAFGTIPTANTAELPKTSFALNTSFDELDSKILTSDRMELFTSHGNKIINGSIASELQYGQWDELLQAATMGTWTMDVLKVGQVARSFAIEDGFLDLADPTYKKFSGVRVNGFDMSVAPNSYINVTLNLIGKNEVVANTPISANVAAISNNQPMTHVGSSIQINGSDVKASGLSFSLTNHMDGDYVIGSSAVANISSYEVEVTGQLTILVEDFETHAQFIDEEDVEIEAVFTDGTNDYTVNFPKARLNTSEHDLGGSGSVTQKMTFRALKDSVSGSPIVITRS